jgi:hypothetical protein
VKLRRCRFGLPGPMSDTVSALRSVSTKPDQAHDARVSGSAATPANSNSARTGVIAALCG